ncbi:hypothetical protein RN001_011007 [Aquatica leii]|uniref:Uncharacterized protein n=1 Tax=Aquatica leii TaxID=1421715 RepID=A0AAN7PAI6_9COLE|nr:hypothetical protein RN001_011007 [Aquatica leii]
MNNSAVRNYILASVKTPTTLRKMPNTLHHPHHLPPVAAQGVANVQILKHQSKPYAGTLTNTAGVETQDYNIDYESQDTEDAQMDRSPIELETVSTQSLAETNRIDDNIIETAN